MAFFPNAENLYVGDWQIADKVCIVRMKTNTDNVESSLLISILLNIRNLYKYSSVTSCTCLAVDGLNCRVPASMKCVVQVVTSVGNIQPYIGLLSITV